MLFAKRTEQIEGWGGTLLLKLYIWKTFSGKSLHENDD